MKIVVMSDTHLNQVTDEFKVICARYCDDADLVIHLGDWVATSVLNYMEQYPLEAVAGNTDNHTIRNELPAQKVIRVDGYRIGIVHGWGSAFELRSNLAGQFSKVDAILYGHSHQAMQSYEHGIFWFNPGSVFMGRGNSPCSLGILQTRGRLQGEIVPL